MAKMYITTLHRGIASVLLASQLLTSCGFHETVLPRKEQPPQEIIKLLDYNHISHPSILATASDQRYASDDSSQSFETPTYTTREGHQIQLIQKEGQCLAEVRESLPPGFSRSSLFPLYLQAGLSIQDITPSSYMEVVFSRQSNGTKGYVVFARHGGLLGGGEGGSKSSSSNGCAFRDDERVWNSNLGRYTCPGSGQHPRSSRAEIRREERRQERADNMDGFGDACNDPDGSYDGSGSDGFDDDGDGSGSDGSGSDGSGSDGSGSRCEEEQDSDDEDYTIQRVKHNGKYLQYASARLKDNKEVVLAAVREDGDALEFASERLRNDREVVIEAVNNHSEDYKALQYVSEDFKEQLDECEDKEWESAKQMESSYDKVTKCIRDKDKALEAIKEDAGNYYRSSRKLQKDREVLLEAIAKDHMILEIFEWSFNSCYLKDIRNVIFESYMSDRAFVLDAVKRNGLAIWYLEGELAHDPEIIIEAVRQNGLALQYAGELRNDRKVVIEAVTQNIEALEYASERLRNDRESILEAVRKKSEAKSAREAKGKQEKEEKAAASSPTEDAPKSTTPKPKSSVPPTQLTQTAADVLKDIILVSDRADWFKKKKIAHDDGRFIAEKDLPKDAKCNIGVYSVFEKLTGSKALNGKNANDIVDHFADSPDWEEIPMDQAQQLANEGNIVMVGWKNPLASPRNRNSGHVAMVVPGEMGQSDGWGGKVPMTFDVGKNVRQSKDRMSEGIGAAKKSTTKFYRYQGSVKK